MRPSATSVQGIELSPALRGGYPTASILIHTSYLEYNILQGKTERGGNKKKGRIRVRISPRTLWYGFSPEGSRDALTRKRGVA